MRPRLIDPRRIIAFLILLMVLASALPLAGCDDHDRCVKQEGGTVKAYRC